MLATRLFLPLWLGLVAASHGGESGFCAAVESAPIEGARVLGNGSPGSVSSAQLQAAFDAGGVILLDLGATPGELVVSDTLRIDRPLVLDAGGLTLSGGGLRRILEIGNANPAADAPPFTVVLQNIGFRDGRAEGRGGAIYKRHDFEFPHKVSLRLVDCHFDDNLAALDDSPQDDGGGAFYGELLARIDINRCRLRNNRGSNGGALYSLGSLAVNIVDSEFDGNAAIGSGGNPGNGGNGGALGVDGAERTVDICRTRIVNNTANAFGAGFFSVMYDASSRTRFEDTLIQGNRQLDAGQHSGGLYIQGGPWALERVSVIANEASAFAGLFVAGNAPGIVRNTTFVGNLARSGLGGAMALTDSAPIHLINTTIAHNVARDAFAAGIQINSPNQLRLTNVLLADNVGGNRFVPWNIRNPAAEDGGGNLQWPPSRPDNGGTEPLAVPSVQLADPLLASEPGDNGGRVPTLALGDTSPARDAGVGGADVAPTDARGLPRFGAVDSGSFEVQDSGRIFADGYESVATAAAGR